VSSYLTPQPGLPSPLYVSASLAQSNTRLLIARWTVIIYMSLGVAILGWCLACLFWAMRIQGPSISPFPLVDFTSRVASGGMFEGSPAATLANVASTPRFRRRLQDMRLFLREWRDGDGGGVDDSDDGNGTDSGNRIMGFSTTKAGLERLERRI
jgi:hypothetical protein